MNAFIDYEKSSFFQDCIQIRINLFIILTFLYNAIDLSLAVLTMKMICEIDSILKEYWILRIDEWMNSPRILDDTHVQNIMVA